MAVAGSERQRAGERLIAIAILPYDDEFCGRCPRAIFRHCPGMVGLAAYCEEWAHDLALEAAPRMAHRLPECVRGERMFAERVQVRPDRPPARRG